MWKKNFNCGGLFSSLCMLFFVVELFNVKFEACDVWFLRYGVWPTKFLVIYDGFLPFYPPNNPENKNFGKMEKTSGHIIILHICTINDNHIMYGSWDIERNRIFVVLDHFCPFTALTTWKIKILKKWKKLLEILSFYKCAP